VRVRGAEKTRSTAEGSGSAVRPTAASAGSRGDALGVARICARTLIAASTMALAGCFLFVPLILPQIEVHLDQEFAREVAWSLWWCWIVHLIARLLF
jgi:hypothetical protein